MSGIEDAMATQFAPWQGLYEFRCRRCQHWEGGCGCAKGVFVAAEGCNTAMCTLFEEETCARCLRARQR